MKPELNSHYAHIHLPTLRVSRSLDGLSISTELGRKSRICSRSPRRLPTMKNRQSMQIWYVNTMIPWYRNTVVPSSTVLAYYRIRDCIENFMLASLIIASNVPANLRETLSSWYRGTGYITRDARATPSPKTDTFEVAA